MSARAKEDARTRLQKAGRAARASLDDQSTSCKQLWEGLKKCLGDEDAIWDPRRRSADAAHARKLVHAALSARDLTHAAETLTHWAALGLPLVSDKILAALTTLKHEDDLESLWRRATSAIEAGDRADLEFWCHEAASKELCVPMDMKAAIQALHGQERALRAEEEYQEKLKVRVTEARMREDTGALKALAMEARLLGEDPSIVDAVLGPVKSYRRKRCPEQDTPESTPRTKSSGVKEIKEELSKRGISAAGVLDKDELINLLARARTNDVFNTDRASDAFPTDRANDAFHSDGAPTEVPPRRVSSVPSTPKGLQSNAGGLPVNSKPPVGPRPRHAPVGPRPNPTPMPPAMPPGMPGFKEDMNAEGSRRPPASASAFSSAWASEPGTPSRSSRPFVASPRPFSYDEDNGPAANVGGAAQRPARPSSARPSTQTDGYEDGTPRRRPSSASARETPMRGGSRGCEASPAHRPCGTSSASSGDNPLITGAENPATPQRRSSSASVRSTATPADCETPSYRRPQRPLSASLAGRPLFADMRTSEAAASPRPSRIPSSSTKPPSYSEPFVGDTTTPQRRPASASVYGRDGRSGRIPAASGPGPEIHLGADSRTAQGTTRPSAAKDQDAASPPRGRSPSPWQRFFSTPAQEERRQSKRNFSMPPKPPGAQSPRPSTPPRTSAAPPTRVSASTPTRDAALTCLGLKGMPSGDEVRRAYKQAALRCHPDRPQNHGCAEEAKANFQQVKEAFDYLQAPIRRSAAAAGGC